MPDPVKEEFVNVGVALYTLDGVGPKFCDVLFTRSWSRAKCLDPDLDPEEIQGLEQQIRDAVWDSASGSIDSLRESFGGRVQLTQSKVVLTESPEAELKLLSQAYLERQRTSSRDVSGRQVILNTMRREFERQGVWSFLQSAVPVAKYTEEGDPLKIDFAYRPSGSGRSLIRMFHAVSLERDINAAKVLAFSCPRIRAGLREKEKSQLQMTAIIEAELPSSREIEFGQRVMRENGVLIKTVADVPAIAERAREELNL